MVEERSNPDQRMRKRVSSDESALVCDVCDSSGKTLPHESRADEPTKLDHHPFEHYEYNRATPTTYSRISFHAFKALTVKQGTR
jgi:hypothetical protein